MACRLSPSRNLSRRRSPRPQARPRRRSRCRKWSPRRRVGTPPCRRRCRPAHRSRVCLPSRPTDRSGRHRPGRSCSRPRRWAGRRPCISLRMPMYSTHRRRRNPYGIRCCTSMARFSPCSGVQRRLDRPACPARPAFWHRRPRPRSQLRLPRPSKKLTGKLPFLPRAGQLRPIGSSIARHASRDSPIHTCP
jgi:hypothetical protein